MKSNIDLADFIEKIKVLIKVMFPKMFFLVLLINSLIVVGQDKNKSDTIFIYTQKKNSDISTYCIKSYERDKGSKDYLMREFFNGGFLFIEYYPYKNNSEANSNLWGRQPYFLWGLNDNPTEFPILKMNELSGIFNFHIDFSVKEFNEYLHVNDTLVIGLEFMEKKYSIFLPVLKGFHCYNYDINYKSPLKYYLSSSKDINSFYISFTFKKRDPIRIKKFLSSFSSDKFKNLKDNYLEKTDAVKYFKTTTVNKPGTPVEITQYLKTYNIKVKVKCDCKDGKREIAGHYLSSGTTYKKNCYVCGGSGKVHATGGAPYGTYVRCWNCNGSGYVLDNRPPTGWVEPKIVTCDSCNGTGIATKTKSGTDNLVTRYRWKVSIQNNTDAQVKYYNYETEKYEVPNKVFDYDFFSNKKNEPIIIATKSKNYYLMAFDNQGFPIEKIVIENGTDKEFFSILGF